MYRDEILDLYKNPLNSGEIREPDLQLKGENNSCGDHITLYVKLEGEKISEIKHESQACAICTASTSILTEEIKGLSKEEAKNLSSDWMIDKLGIDISPMRMKCALLGLKTLQEGLE